MLSRTSQTKLEEFFGQFKSAFHKRRDILIYADETPNSVFYIKNGFARAYRISETGDELTLTILSSGSLFPITSGIQDLPNNYYLEAIIPMEVWKAPKEQFATFLHRNPEVFYELTTNILSRYGDLLTRMEYLVVSRAYTKVATTLLLCAEQFGTHQGSDVILQIPLTHKDIATLAGLTRETTCLEMKKLEKKGLIGRLGRLFVIKDLDGLKEESNSILNEYSAVNQTFR